MNENLSKHGTWRAIPEYQNYLVSYKFQNVRLVIEGCKVFPTIWVLRISNPLSLIDYWIQTQPSITGRAISNFMSCKDPRVGHLNTELGNLVSHLAEASGDSFMNVLIDTLDAKLQGMIKILHDGHTLLVNRKGGYTFETDHARYRILSQVVKEKLIYPTYEGKAEIKQWPNGIHYYAKFGDVDVVVNGKQKWNTYEEAREASKKFQETE